MQIFQAQFKSAGTYLRSLPAILRRVPNPVEPFSFLIVQDRLPLSCLGRIREGLGQLADLFEQLEEGHVNRQ